MKRVHFVAIGGQGMSGIAKILLTQGYSVSGSDLKESNLTRHLVSMGAVIHRGHQAENLGDPDVVVVSSAIHEDNPELLEAGRRGIPVVHRMDMLLQVVKGKRLLAVAGSHGKTTTASMIAWVLKEAGVDPMFLVAGEFGKEGNAYPGKGEYAVIETDESDGSFLKAHADIALVTNIDNDHLEHWGSMDALENAFYRFLDGVKGDGVRIVCTDDRLLGAWAVGKRGVETYSTSLKALWEAKEVVTERWGSRARIFHKGEEAAVLRLGMPGNHNLGNALGALAAAYAAGVHPARAAEHLASYPGVKRRLERVGEFGGVLVLDDFAHHPREIKALLLAVRTALPGRKITVVFQPHRFARTRLLKEEFGKALLLADNVFVTGIYAGPGEDVETGVSPMLVCEALKVAGHESARAFDDMKDAAAEAARTARPGEVVITVGAGDVFRTHGTIKEILLARGQ